MNIKTMKYVNPPKGYEIGIAFQGDDEVNPVRAAFVEHVKELRELGAEVDSFDNQIRSWPHKWKILSLYFQKPEDILTPLTDFYQNTSEVVHGIVNTSTSRSDATQLYRAQRRRNLGDQMLWVVTYAEALIIEHDAKCLEDLDEVTIPYDSDLDAAFSRIIVGDIDPRESPGHNID